VKSTTSINKMKSKFTLDHATNFGGFKIFLDPHAANAAPADDENERMQYNDIAAGEGRSLNLGAASPTLRRIPTTRCTTDCRSFGKHAG
jgi:hypothetical protein